MLDLKRRANGMVPTQQSVSVPQAVGPVTPPILALNRLGYGPRPPASRLVQNPESFQGDIARVTTMGLDAYIDQQLNPIGIDDSFCTTQLANARHRIQYDAGSNNNGSWSARDEFLPLGYLTTSTTSPLPNATAEQIGWTVWDLYDWDKPMAYDERIRPWLDVRTATLIRAVYSQRQLLEVLVDFWHNHFNVWPASDVAIATSFPEYDRIIRSNALGNFNTFVEAIAHSTAMLYYLDNYSNRAAGGEGGNENYARELFELHTMGSDNYLKFYDDRSQVGTILYNGEVFARGYLDKDVYEAAECLTGWTVKNGDWRLPAGTPNDGTFMYNHPWHASGAKIVLNQIIDNGQSPLKYEKDGKDVIKLLTDHVGTARHLCTKLCRRFIADEPPTTVVEAAVTTWMANRNAPDQIKQVLRTILRSSEFRSSWGQKVKRPFDFLVSYIRATGSRLDLTDSGDPVGSTWDNLFWQLGNTGHRLFEWQPPTGHPDRASFWLSTNGMLQRWNLPYTFSTSGQWGMNAPADLFGQTPTGLTSTQIVDFWIERLFGYAISATTRTTLITFMAGGGSATAQPRLYQGETSLQERIECLVYLLTMSPEFQNR